MKYICLFVSFFQLCYRISERGITLLLTFIRALISWIVVLTNSPELLYLKEMLPRNIYFLRKECGRNYSTTTYVVCPKCHCLYSLKDCTIHQNGNVESVLCSYFPYPNHPHVSRRTKCNTPLMKRVKYGAKYKLVPRKVYIYNSLKSSLAKLFSRRNFSTLCNQWQSRSKFSEI